MAKTTKPAKKFSKALAKRRDAVIAGPVQQKRKVYATDAAPGGRTSYRR